MAWPVFGAAAALAALWTVYAGKDLNWDLLHYHYYAAHAFVEGRLGRDFFAASAQGYLNPIGFLPFYWMVSSGWHSVAVSAVVAAAHAANIALLYGIAQRLFAHHDERARMTLSLLAAALGSASAVFWAAVGTSFLDPLLTVPMLGGVLLLIEEDARHVRGTPSRTSSGTEPVCRRAGARRRHVPSQPTLAVSIRGSRCSCWERF